MTSMNVWDVCKFSDEIIAGNLNMSKFAVELHSVLDDTADKIYTDPQLFLDNTYLTSNAKIMLRDALTRIGSGKGQPVYVIDTEFGGGKTHTLVLLYHALRNPDLATEYIKKTGFPEQYGISKVPAAKVVAIVCRRLRTNTLWGELALSLGRYDGDVRVSDEKKQKIKNIEVLNFSVTNSMIV